ncbi:MAG: sulfotransferase [Marmoricola sp.]|nr:sulfotransferase [Marmoricola sp.]
MTGSPPRLPEVIVIGAMKCATSAVHHYLDAHPSISMSAVKELNFFNGPEVAPHDDPGQWWRTGQWHRGVTWYADQFDPHVAVRGESSPAYTAPGHVEVAERMAGVVPQAQLLYLVRNPVDRAASQYAHHRRDGTEGRPLAEAVLDPASEYVARSRYHERLVPFLQRFRREQVRVVVQERLREHRLEEMAHVYQHVGVEATWREDRLATEIHVGSRVEVPAGLRAEVTALVEDDVDDLRILLEDDLAEWDA